MMDHFNGSPFVLYLKVQHRLSTLTQLQQLRQAKINSIYYNLETHGRAREIPFWKLIFASCVIILWSRVRTTYVEVWPGVNAGRSATPPGDSARVKGTILMGGYQCLVSCRTSIPLLYMYMYNCDFFVCFRTYLFVRALLAKILKLRRYRKAVRNLWSRFELDPSTVARLAGAQSFFFSGSG